MLDESVVGELAGSGKPVHAFADFEENLSVVDDTLELVLLHDNGDSHLPVVVHRSVEVFDVDHYVFCIWSG